MKTNVASVWLVVACNSLWLTACDDGADEKELTAQEMAMRPMMKGS